jgi:acetolactate decarboxylase
MALGRCGCRVSCGPCSAGSLLLMMKRTVAEAETHDEVTGGVSRRNHQIFQAGLIAALIDGVYEGDMAVSELLDRGNFGLGTFNSLDGEMIVVDSACYRLGGGGAVSVPSGEELVPFAIVTHFRPDVSFEWRGKSSRTELIDRLSRSVPSKNYLCAARITGQFSQVAVRNVVKQEPPFRPLAAVTDGEPVSRLDDVAGVMVGFQTPAYERGIGVPGGHLHFIDDARAVGGHVIDFVSEQVTVEICIGTELVIRLPTTPEFEGADLDPPDLDVQVGRAENHR